MSNVAQVSKIRQAFRALRNAVESKGSDERKYNLMMGVSFAPAKGLTADALVEAVNNNRKISPELVYGMQAGLKIEPQLKITKDEVVAQLNAFEAQLALLPQDIGANMTLEFNVENEHEKTILEETQKGISAIQEANQGDVKAVAALKSA